MYPSNTLHSRNTPARASRLQSDDDGRRRSGTPVPSSSRTRRSSASARSRDSDRVLARAQRFLERRDSGVPDRRLDEPGRVCSSRRLGDRGVVEKRRREDERRQRREVRDAAHVKVRDLPEALGLLDGGDLVVARHLRLKKLELGRVADLLPEPHARQLRLGLLERELRDPEMDASAARYDSRTRRTISARRSSLLPAARTCRAAAIELHRNPPWNSWRDVDRRDRRVHAPERRSGRDATASSDAVGASSRRGRVRRAGRACPARTVHRRARSPAGRCSIWRSSSR